MKKRFGNVGAGAPTEKWGVAAATALPVSVLSCSQFVMLRSLYLWGYRYFANGGIVRTEV
jgi:hypothetical protein